MTTPAVSLLIPARDAADTLPLCLASIERQRDRDWEAVVVDDGSRDATPAIIAAAARRDSRFRLIAGDGRGLVAALQRGLAECRAPLVARMDADDWMHRDRLTLQRAALANDPTLSGVGSQVRISPRPADRDAHSRHGAADRRGRFAYERWLNGLCTPEDLAREAFVECPIAHPTLMLRRDWFERVGYREVDWPEDYDLVLRLLAEGARLGVVPRRLLAWRDHPARLSRRSPRYGHDRFTACKAEFLARGLLAGHAHYVLWGYGQTGRRLHRALAQRGKRASHIVELHPRRIGQRIQDAPVVSPESLPELAGLPLIASVAGTGPRGEIRAALRQLGRIEGRDFICAA